MSETRRDTIALPNPLACQDESECQWEPWCRIDNCCQRVSVGLHWIDVSVRLPDHEDRYFVVYRTGNNKVEKAWVGDYIASEGRWSSMPANCEVIYWMPVPHWARSKVHGTGRNS